MLREMGIHHRRMHVCMHVHTWYIRIYVYRIRRIIPIPTRCASTTAWCRYAIRLRKASDLRFPFFVSLFSFWTRSADAAGDTTSFLIPRDTIGIYISLSRDRTHKYRTKRGRGIFGKAQSRDPFRCLFTVQERDDATRRYVVSRLKMPLIQFSNSGNPTRVNTKEWSLKCVCWNFHQISVRLSCS